MLPGCVDEKEQLYSCEARAHYLWGGTGEIRLIGKAGATD